MPPLGELSLQLEHGDTREVDILMGYAIARSVRTKALERLIIVSHCGLDLSISMNDPGMAPGEHSAARQHVPTSRVHCHIPRLPELYSTRESLRNACELQKEIWQPAFTVLEKSRPNSGGHGHAMSIFLTST